MEDRQKIKKRLITLLTELFDVQSKEINEHLEFINLPVWDSLTQVRFVVAVENEFGIRFDYRDVENLRKFGSAVELIDEKIT